MVLGWLFPSRVEKEKNQLRSELEDVQAQAEHVSKGKVHPVHGNL